MKLSLIYIYKKKNLIHKKQANIQSKWKLHPVIFYIPEFNKLRVPVREKGCGPAGSSALSTPRRRQRAITIMRRLDPPSRPSDVDKHRALTPGI